MIKTDIQKQAVQTHANAMKIIKEGEEKFLTAKNFPAKKQGFDKLLEGITLQNNLFKITNNSPQKESMKNHLDYYAKSARVMKDQQDNDSSAFQKTDIVESNKDDTAKISGELNKSDKNLVKPSFSGTNCTETGLYAAESNKFGNVYDSGPQKIQTNIEYQTQIQQNSLFKKCENTNEIKAELTNSEEESYILESYVLSNEYKCKELVKFGPSYEKELEYLFSSVFDN